MATVTRNIVISLRATVIFDHIFCMGSVTGDSVSPLRAPVSVVIDSYWARGVVTEVPFRVQGPRGGVFTG